MDELRQLPEILIASYTKLVDGFISTVPKLILGLLLLVFGWIIAKIVSRIVVKFLRAVRFDKAMERLTVGRMLKRLKVEKAPSQIAGKFIYWLLMLLLFSGFAEALQLDGISQKIGMLINYLPNIVIAVFILVLGLFIAGSVKELVNTTFTSYGIKSGRFIGNIIFYILAGMIVLTALEQLQFNIDLITSNVMILIGGVALAFAIGYGLSAKEIFPNIISSYYGKNLFSIGQTIRIDDVEGQILEIGSMAVVIKTKEGKRYIPAKKLVTEVVDVVEK